MTSETATYKGYRSAGGRLKEAAVAPLLALKGDLPPEQVAGLHAFDRAHTVMMVERGIIPAAVGQAILKALRDMDGGRGHDGLMEARTRSGGGIHSGEQYLIQALGRAFGGYLHIGRSSGDLGHSTRNIGLRHQAQDLAEAINTLRSALFAKVEGHLDTVMPAYTHGLTAQPTTFAHWLTMHEAGFGRDFDRLAAVYRRLNASPAGAAILSGSDFPLDRERVAALLGFDDVHPHTMDAILSHDTDTEYVAVLAVLAQNLARLCDDLMQYATNEFAMVELADRHCGTSSIMPQKRNPDILEHVKEAAGRAFGAVTAVAMNERGPTGWPVLERRSNNRLMWDLGRDLKDRCLWMADVIDGLTPRPERMTALAERDWATATDLASYLVREGGTDWRSAHTIIGALVRKAHEAGRFPADMVSADIAEAAAEVNLPAPTVTDEG